MKIRIKNMFDETHELIGWLGMFLILLAYIGISTGHFKVGDLVYQASNLCGSIALLYSAAKTKSYPLVVLNIAWLIVAIASIYQFL